MNNKLLAHWPSEGNEPIQSCTAEDFCKQKSAVDPPHNQLRLDRDGTGAGVRVDPPPLPLKFWSKSATQIKIWSLTPLHIHKISSGWTEMELELVWTLPSPPKFRSKSTTQIWIWSWIWIKSGPPIS